MQDFQQIQQAAVTHLNRSDAVMAATINRIGPCSLKLRRMRFASLVRAIVGQQISTKAAQSIYQRLKQHVAPLGITPASLETVTSEELRKLGLSQQKAAYTLDLVNKVNQRTVKLQRHRDYDNQSIIDELTQVKGIGRWTAEMYLMFSLGRPDVLPLDDFGIKTAMLRLYRPGETEIDRETMRAIAEPWRPYRTIACWYCWRSLA